MPIYEFQCNDCKSDFEKLVRRISAIDEVSCPECNSLDVNKKLSIFSSKVAGASQSATSNAGACSPGGG